MFRRYETEHLSVERYERFTERHRRKELLELMKEPLVVVTQLVDEVVSDSSCLLLRS